MPGGIKTVLLTAQLSSAELQLHFSPSVRNVPLLTDFFCISDRKQHLCISFSKSSLPLSVHLLHTQRSVWKWTWSAEYFCTWTFHDTRFKIIIINYSAPLPVKLPFLNYLFLSLTVPFYWLTWHLIYSFLFLLSVSLLAIPAKQKIWAASGCKARSEGYSVSLTSHSSKSRQKVFRSLKPFC